ncbi:MAG: glycosyltransferase [Mesorhizobium sp.]
MKVLFARGSGYLPESVGGVESSTHHLAQQLIERGHDVSVLAALFGDGIFGFKARVKMKLLRQPAVIDTFLGYPVTRAWFPWEAVSFAVKRTRPDVAVVQCHKSVPLGKALQAEGVPLVVYLRNVEFNELGGDLRELHSATYVANSRFTARKYKQKFDIDSTVIPPTIDPAAYNTQRSGKFVTMINPCEEKGFDLAVKIGEACPEIPFLFVESWKLSPDQRAQIEKAIAPFPNISLESRTHDMKTVYGRTKILLAPSKWEEAWGRVASEAHCSGIPVVGSTQGGLPEAIGPGGVVLDYNAPVEDWIAAIRRLWNDTHAYEQISTAARTFSKRPELDPERQFETFFSVLDLAVEQSTTSRRRVNG